MELQSKKTLVISSGFLLGIDALFIVAFILFEGGSTRIISSLITSVLLCVTLVFFLFYYGYSFRSQPGLSWLLIGIYLLANIMLCFPNPVVTDLSLYYIILLPIAGFLNLRFSLIMLFGFFATYALLEGRLTMTEILHVSYCLISCVLINGTRERKQPVQRILLGLILQLILLFLCINVKNIVISPYTEGFILLIITCVSILTVWMGIREQSLTTQEESIMDESLPDIPNVELQLTKVPVYEPSKPYGILYLVRKDSELLVQMKKKSGKSMERSQEIADFARHMAFRVGADCDLTYAIALYHDYGRIMQKENDVGASQINFLVETGFPETLAHSINQQNDGNELPTSLEALIVMISNNIVTMYHFIRKSEKNVSIRKLIENTFQMHLKKGTIRTSGISMSMYHKLRQEFINEFILLYQIEEE